MTSPAFRPLLVALGLAALALLAGCTTPPAHRYGERRPEDKLESVVVLPIDAEVSELSAGGMVEKRDDWTAAVVAHLNSALAGRAQARLPAPWPESRAAELGAELEDVSRLFRAISFNQLFHTHLPTLPAVPATTGTLVYQLGPLDALLDAQQADAALLLFVHDQYATAGRKGLVFLGAVAGIPVHGGFTMSSAALATRDGRLLWMNLQASQLGDLRQPQDAAALVERLLAAAPATRPGRLAAP